MGTMNLAILVIGLTGLTHSSDYDLREGSKTPGQGELTADQAYARVRSLIQSCKAVDHGERPELCLEDNKGTRTWEYLTPSGAWFRLDSKSGVLLHFTGEGTSIGTDKAYSNEPCQSLFPTEESLRARLTDLANAAGMPSKAKLGPAIDGNVAVKGVFTPFGGVAVKLFHKGREVLGCWGNYSIDLRDGSAVAMDQRYEYQIANEEPVISAQDAVSRAEAPYVAELARLRQEKRFFYHNSVPPGPTTSTGESF